MKVKRSIISDLKGSPRLQKAVAFAMLLKHKIGRDSIVRNYTTNKLHTLTHASPTTIKKYLPLLKQMGIAKNIGKNGEHLLIAKIKSSNDSRNYNLNINDKTTLRDVYQSIRAFIALLIQYRKDYVRRTLLAFSNPQKGDDYKALRKQVKGLVKAKVLGGIYQQYKERGISYKRIAKETGNCIRTAQRIIKYAINQNWVDKFVNVVSECIRGVNGRYVEGFDFTTRNYAYKIFPNSYKLKPTFVSLVELDGKK